MVDAAWKRSDRTTCPRCGSTNWKKESRIANAIWLMVTCLIMAVVFFFLGFIFFPFWLISVASVVAAVVSVFKPFKTRKCLDCKKTWEYYREPDESTTS